jgi:hypothetical protein
MSKYIKTYMKKFLLLCCILAAPILITSCGKDSASPPPNTAVGYFHLATGSNWVYSNYKLLWDSDSTHIKQVDENDTLTLQNYQQVLGKNAMMMQHHFVNPLVNVVVTDANYAIYEDETTDRLYVSSDFMKIFLPELLQSVFPMITFDKDWYLLADYNSTKEWMLDSFELANFTSSVLYELMPMLDSNGIELNGHIKFGIRKWLDTTILFGDIIPLKANTYQMSMFFEGTATSSKEEIAKVLATAGKIRIDFAQINFYLGGQSGLLGVLSPAREITITNPLLELLFDGFVSISKIDGFEKRLIKLDAKKKD